MAPQATPEGGAEPARLGLEKRGCDKLEVNDDWAWERTGEQAWEKCDIQIQEVSSDEDDDGVVKRGSERQAGQPFFLAAIEELLRISGDPDSTGPITRLAIPLPEVCA